MTTLLYSFPRPVSIDSLRRMTYTFYGQDYFNLTKEIPSWESRTITRNTENSSVILYVVTGLKI